MPSEAAYETENAYVSVANKHIRQAYSLVKDQLQVGYDPAKRRYDERVKTTKFHEGNQFCVALHSKTKEGSQQEVVTF